MSARSAPRASRRSFLKLGAAAAAGALAWQLPRLPTFVPASSLLRVKSALPMPGYGFLPFPERLLEQPLDSIDVALVPAYVAAMLIQAGRLQKLQGPPGRPHDPEGRYTLPFAYRVAALRFPDGPAAPKAAAWVDLWSAAGGALWPAFGRVITGAALLRRGYSPNDAHPGHMAQAAGDLERLRPQIVPHLSQPSVTRQTAYQRMALVLAELADIGQPNGLRLPAAGTMLIEYDWVITAEAAQAAAARQFIDGLRPAAPPARSDLSPRLIPLMPLPQTARAQHDEIWASLTA